MRALVFAIRNLFVSESMAVGLAMFSMFFGAGNIIFPLAVGQFAGNQTLIATIGLVLTAAIIPIAGVIAMILFEGDYRQFFGRLGKRSGFILALIIISLLGPLGSTPRCIALAFTTLKSMMLCTLSPTLFSGLACLIIFLFSCRKNSILTLLGLFLTPLLLIALLFIIALGILAPHSVETVQHESLSVFVHGLKEGYNTMDLLAAFFFSSTILQILRLRKRDEEKSYIGVACLASVIGAFLLAAIYVGFCYLAASQGACLNHIPKDQLLSTITVRIAGARAGWLVSSAVALACLTTAIALTMAFCDFVQKEVFKERVSYGLILVGSLLITFFVSTFEFTGISAFLNPLLQICYPGLILLTFLNIAYRLYNFKPVKLPVLSAFGISAILYLMHSH